MKETDGVLSRRLSGGQLRLFWLKDLRYNTYRQPVPSIFEAGVSSPESV